VLHTLTHIDNLVQAVRLSLTGPPGHSPFKLDLRHAGTSTRCLHSRDITR